MLRIDSLSLWSYPYTLIGTCSEPTVPIIRSFHIKKCVAQVCLGIRDMSCKRMDTEFQELLPDIPQVACRLASGSPNCASRSSVLRPERGLWSRKRPKLGGSPRKPAASRRSIPARRRRFSARRADLSCRFRSILACIAVTRMTVALAIVGWRRSNLPLPAVHRSPGSHRRRRPGKTAGCCARHTGR